MTGIIWGLVLGLACSLILPLQPSGQARRTSLLQRLLRVAGITASPSTLKAPEQALETGQVWVVDVARGTSARLTAEADYRSPVFELDNRAVVAIRGDMVVRIRGTEKHGDLWRVKGLVKMVGSSRDDPHQVLVLVRDAQGAVSPGFLALETGAVEIVPHDRNSIEDRRLLEHLKGWDRVYEDVRLSVRRETKAGSAGTVQWLDVYLKRGTQPAVNISRCDGVDCGQPSLSPDGRKVVYLRTPVQ